MELTPTPVGWCTLLVAASVLARAVAGQSVPDRPAGPLQVDAGPDRILHPPRHTLTLEGSLAGQRVTLVPPQLQITWSQLSGPVAEIEDGHTLHPRIHPSHPGILRLRMTAVDPVTGASASDDMEFTALGDAQDGDMHGELREWSKVVLTFVHDVQLSETGTPNPFLDLRLSVRFVHPMSGTQYDVPGFYAADGNAAETSATSGRRFRALFSPDHAGVWYYLASFHAGSGIAIDLDPFAGTPLSFDGANGSFEVSPADPDAPGLLAKGRLDYVGGHHLRFVENGEYYLKCGTDSPENFLAYYEFDGTTDLGGTTNDLVTSGHFDGLHHYDAHLADYVDLGAATWKGNRGQRIFGALNYLASKGVNSVYALTYNIDGGDGREVFPWVNANDKLHFDVSKLAQWGRVGDHMARAGIVWHVVTQETENDVVLDNGALGTQRKLYYRELIARFAHVPGLIWNLGEENDNTIAQRKAFSEYIRKLDPYHHPIALHNHSNSLFDFVGLLGTHLELASLQGDPGVTTNDVHDVIDDSAAAGLPWVVNYDEQGPPNDGVVPDAVDFWHDAIRRTALWPTLLGQGGGCEWYFGYAHPHSDLDCEDFRSRQNMWVLTDRATDFLRGNVPFTTMEHANSLATGNTPSVLAQRGQFYLVYLPFGGSTTLNLESNSGAFRVSWFDARNGGSTVNGSVTQISGPGVRSLGAAPGSGDWVAFVRRTANVAPVVDALALEPPIFRGGKDFSFQVRASDANGPSDALDVVLEFYDPTGALRLVTPAPHRGGDLYSYFMPDAPPLAPGIWRALVRVTDELGIETTESTSFEVR